MFLVDLHSNFHKASRIHVLYHTCHRHCIIWEMNLRQNISSGLRKSLFLTFIIKAECNSAVIFLWDNKEKNEINIHYHIQEWNKFTTTYDILQIHYNYPTLCLLLDTTHRTDNCIAVWSKWIFDSNLEFALPLTSDWLNYILSGNDTDEITFVGVLHAIISVPPIGVQKRLNMK